MGYSPKPGYYNNADIRRIVDILSRQPENKGDWAAVERKVVHDYVYKTGVFKR
jgi:hypothetical protein